MSSKEDLRRAAATIRKVVAQSESLPESSPADARLREPATVPMLDPRNAEEHAIEMPEREIASIVWHQAGHHIDVIYVDGDPERLVRPEMYAAELALKEKLRVVPTADGTVRWVQDPDTWHGT